MTNINSNNNKGNMYAYSSRVNYVLDVKDTYIHRLEQEQVKLINVLRGKEIKRFNTIYNEIVDRINAEEL